MNKNFNILEDMENKLNLKHLQIKSLLQITQAINENKSAEDLYSMYNSFMSWEMGVEKMALFVIKEETEWKCVSTINCVSTKIFKVIDKIKSHHRLYTVKDEDDPQLRAFDIVIPVFHKKQPIAYALVAGLKNKEDIYDKIQFIQTITNVIAVAIENKRLFQKQLNQELFKKEIELASKVQQMLIPDVLPKTERYELSSIYKPHLNIGGDYLDYIQFSENKFGFCIADISGKGVGAALLMANFQAMIQFLIYQYKDLETFIFALNQSVYRITKSDKYITLFFAVVDLEEGKFSYINSGHYPPVMINGGKKIRLDQGSTIIGAFEQLPEIKETIIDIEDEMLVLSFTDGIVELQNEEGKYFDDERIEAFVEKNNQMSADAFNDELLTVIDNFKGNLEYADDIAILTCKINKRNG